MDIRGMYDMMKKGGVQVRILLADFSQSVYFSVSPLRTTLQENVAEQQEVRRKAEEEELEAQRLEMEVAAKEEVIEAAVAPWGSPRTSRTRFPDLCWFADVPRWSYHTFHLATDGSQC